MGAQVLGKVTHATDGPRGPDVEFKIAVPQDWLAEGAAIEFELPRNLACAGCGGGGCDTCERAGAVSTRGRREIAEIVQVSLPQPPGDGPPSSGVRALVIRLPGQGGLAAEGSDLPRGNLLLRVRASDQADPGVTRLAASPDLAPASMGPSAPRRAPWIRLLAAAVAIYLLILLFMRITGRG